jgi:AraC family transcriptional regulator of adaptative response / DNA-3-methyladenine glycosylase II
VLVDSDRLWQAIEAGDGRFDGWVFCGVTTTGIYCRPSCPARTPRRENVRLFPTAAAAQRAGFRACKRCSPDATPGSPEWDRRADVVGRAMRLIADGVVDRGGVGALARRLGYTERHLHRQLVAVVGAGPLALARAQRAQTARMLLETTDIPTSGVAFAAGFGSVRQFNATVREVFARSPTELRARARRGERDGADGGDGGDGAIVLRLPYRAPLHGGDLLAFLAARAVPGVEEVREGAYIRSLRLPHGDGVVELRPRADQVEARFHLTEARDLAAAVQRCRALLDLDSDPCAVDAALAGDAVIGELVGSCPGRRLPGHVDGDELALRAVLGQQVSVRGAATHAARLVRDLGEPLTHPRGTVTHVFPSAGAIARAAPERIAMPAARGRALLALARALAHGELSLDPGADPERTRAALIALPGIGPWTTEYIAMRALRDPDVFLATDLGVRRALERLGEDPAPAGARRLAQRWRPYRAYAVIHLWASLADAGKRPSGAGARPRAVRRRRPAGGLNPRPQGAIHTIAAGP